MVVCELCNGPFHGTCLEPPLYEIPDEDFICPVCHMHQVEGVVDCINTNPGAARHEALGIDRLNFKRSFFVLFLNPFFSFELYFVTRNGSKYWFTCRRLWVESLDGETSYFSTRSQLKEVMEVLDKVTYERDLYASIEERREEMEAHMDITEKLTNEKKIDYKRTYLEMENGKELIFGCPQAAL